ncbi:MAG: DoxX family protein [Polyangiales bacterium]
MSAVISAPATRTRGWSRALFRTEDDRVLLGMRLVLAGVIFPHGAQHTLGWFGGFGFAASRDFMAKVTGMPVSVAALACVLELLTPIALAVGVGGRLAAAWIFAMLGMAATTHASNGFFMNWLGNPLSKGEGFEYHLLVLAIAGALVVKGSGAFSIDRRIRAE